MVMQMGNFPEDIDKIATDIVRAEWGDADPEWALYQAICTAIMRERQRCAKLARYAMAEQVAADILEGRHQETI